MAETATQTVELNDAIFCQHLKEVCDDCNYDGREENNAFFGFDPIDRDALEAPTSSQNKDGILTCKKHGSPDCSTCYNWKKQLQKLNNAAKKAGKK